MTTNFKENYVSLISFSKEKHISNSTKDSTHGCNSTWQSHTVKIWNFTKILMTITKLKRIFRYITVPVLSRVVETILIFQLKFGIWHLITGTVVRTVNWNWSHPQSILYLPYCTVQVPYCKVNCILQFLFLQSRGKKMSKKLTFWEVRELVDKSILNTNNTYL